MNKQPLKAYQLHISLLDIKPKIWRRFLVTNDISFADLHSTIQAVMGWGHEHLHEFEIEGRKIGAILDDFFSADVADESGTRLSDLNLTEKHKFEYTYDFGDNWEHEIKVEKILPVEKSVKYPLCLAGEMACPPEDCGGFPGYLNLLELSKLPDEELDEDDLDMLEWFGRDHNFYYFDVDETNSLLKKIRKYFHKMPATK